jgi:hypothetical protein
VTESFAAGNTSELDIRVELDVEPYGAVGPITEDICLAIHSSPGVVDTFSTYFKERRNGTCYLNLILYARPSPKKSKRHDYFQVLPLDVRLHSNWVPFGPLLNASVRATCIWFYGDPEGHPDPRDWVAQEDGEMEGVEVVDVRDERIKFVGCGYSKMARATEVQLVKVIWEIMGWDGTYIEKRGTGSSRRLRQVWEWDVRWIRN